MDNSPATHSFEGTQIRTVIQNETPWFVASDVCDVLNVKQATRALTALDHDEKAEVSLTHTSSNGVEQSRQFLIINESGLYTLILRSRKAVTPGTPQHRFRKWVTSKVLPALRKTGRYQTNARDDDETYKAKYYRLMEKYIAISEQLAEREREIRDLLLNDKLNHYKQVLANNLIKHTDMTDEEISDPVRYDADYIAYLRTKHH